eukprot:1108885-Pelagomonas_calceolata.AAC.2
MGVGEVADTVNEESIAPKAPHLVSDTVFGRGPEDSTNMPHAQGVVHQSVGVASMLHMPDIVLTGHTCIALAMLTTPRSSTRSRSAVMGVRAAAQKITYNQGKGMKRFQPLQARTKPAMHINNKHGISTAHALMPEYGVL